MDRAPDDGQKSEFATWMSYFEFEQRVKWDRRYVWDDEVRAFLATVLGTIGGRESRIQSGSVLWRAQLGVDWIPDDYEPMNLPVGFSPERMKPNSLVAREGRASPAGIPVLYLATTEEAAISEVRPWVGSKIAVAQFRVVRDLAIIDLTRGADDASFGHLTMAQLTGEAPVSAEEKERLFWIDIDSSFSKPIAPEESGANYVPTQILAELFKHAGHDGIIYRSQFGESGKNAVIFNMDDADIINCGPYEVSGVEVKYGVVGNHWFATQDE